MFAAFKTHIEQQFAFLKRGKLLIACSGGLDSVVLSRLCHKLDVSIGLAHCNFNLRAAESDGDEAFVTELAIQLGCAIHTKHMDTAAYAAAEKVSIQMAARALRYDWFQEVVHTHGYDYVLTAHHSDDNLETFLINVSRGTGIEGLAGIPEVNATYIRPLLPFSRAQIRSYAEDHGIQWREDSSNKSTKYLRNKLRHEVIPVLKTITPSFLQNFETTLTHVKQVNLFVQDQVARVRDELFEFQELDIIKIPIPKLIQYQNPKTYLYFLLKEYGFTAWNDVYQLLEAQSGKQVFSATHRLLKDRTDLLLSPLKPKVDDRTYSLPEGEDTILVPFGVLKLKAVKQLGDKNLTTIYVDKEKLKYPLVVRKWKEGDYFYPLGMHGKKKLSKFFKDEKLSLLAKERVWVLCAGDAIVWVINYRADHRFRITPRTKQLLKVTIT